MWVSEGGPPHLGGDVLWLLSASFLSLNCEHIWADSCLNLEIGVTAKDDQRLICEALSTHETQLTIFSFPVWSHGALSRVFFFFLTRLAPPAALSLDLMIKPEKHMNFKSSRRPSDYFFYLMLPRPPPPAPIPPPTPSLHENMSFCRETACSHELKINHVTEANCTIHALLIEVFAFLPFLLSIKAFSPRAASCRLDLCIIWYDYVMSTIYSSCCPNIDLTHKEWTQLSQRCVWCK